MSSPEQKAINFALLACFDNKDIKKLKAAHFGAALRIIQAALKGEVQPFEANHTTLEYFARATPRQWIKIRGGVMDALRGAFPVIKNVYQSRLEMLEKRIKCNPQNIRKYNERRKLEASAKREAHNFTEQSAAPSILQPIKAPRFHNESIDMQQRQAIKNTPSAPGALHD